jgi:hypothetical protein
MTGSARRLNDVDNAAVQQIVGNWHHSVELAISADPAPAQWSAMTDNQHRNRKLSEY